MRKALAKGLIIIVEASLYVLAELITKRRQRNGNTYGLHRVYCGRPADDLRYIGVGHSGHSWRGVRRGRRPGR